VKRLSEIDGGLLAGVHRLVGADNDLTEALERHYGAELMRRNHQHRSSIPESPFTEPNDPPF